MKTRSSSSNSYSGGGVSKSADEKAKRYIAQVYALSFFGCLVAALGAKANLERWRVGGMVIEAGTHMYIAQVVSLFLISMGNKSETISGVSWWRSALFATLAFSAGVNVGSWVRMALQEAGVCVGDGWSFVPDLDWLGAWTTGNISAKMCTPKAVNNLILEAMLMTGGTYVCFAVSSVYAKRGWSANVASFVSAGLWIMFGSSFLASMGWLSPSAFDFVYVKAGLILYCFKVMVDTDTLWTNAQNGYFDVVGSACNVMLNVLHMFIRIIQLLAESKSRSKEKKRGT